MTDIKPKVYRSKPKKGKVYKTDSKVYSTGNSRMPRSETTYPGINRVYQTNKSKYKK